MCMFGLGKGVALMTPFPSSLFPSSAIPNPTMSGWEDVLTDAQQLLQRQSKQGDRRPCLYTKPQAQLPMEMSHSKYLAIKHMPWLFPRLEDVSPCAQAILTGNF